MTGEGTIAEVLAGSARWALVRGDGLAVLRDLPPACIDMLATDPPYSSGGFTRGDRMGSTESKYVQTTVVARGLTVRPDFAGDNRDQRAFAMWCTLWLGEALQKAKPGAAIACFTDWRQLPTTTDVVQAGGWIWRGIVPWDKGTSHRPTEGRFSAQCEYIVWGSAGAMPFERDAPTQRGYLAHPHEVDRRDAIDASMLALARDLVADTCGDDRPMGHQLARLVLERDAFDPSASVIRATNVRHDKHHMTGKPVPLMERIVELCERGGVVLDLFAGSASTGVACLRQGRRFIGVELTEENYAIGLERMRAEERGLSPAAARAGQVSLFDMPDLPVVPHEAP